MDSFAKFSLGIFGIADCKDRILGTGIEIVFFNFEFRIRPKMKSPKRYRTSFTINILLIEQLKKKNFFFFVHF